MNTTNTKPIKIARHVRGTLCAIATLILVLTGARQASAGWRAVDAQSSWAAFMGTFQYTGRLSYMYDFSKTPKVIGISQQDFWREAELIELAVDAYEENKTTANKNEVQGLCDGFEGLYGDDWSGDTFYDDRCWACIAFTRAYIATGTPKWLTLAENNLNTIWITGEDSVSTGGDGGIWWTTSHTTKASASNWTFVIASRLVYNLTGNTVNLNRANVVWNFCLNHLYESGTGRVYNSYNADGTTDTYPWTYNFGVAVGAASESGNAGVAYNAAWYLMNDFPANYYATNINSYWILPRYNHNQDDSGFNGIAFRWLNTAYSHNLLPSTYLAWAQQNVSQAWAERNATAQSWNDWISVTPSANSGLLYSFDCSDTLCGMLNVPPTN